MLALLYNTMLGIVVVVVIKYCGNIKLTLEFAYLPYLCLCFNYDAVTCLFTRLMIISKSAVFINAGPAHAAN